MIIPSRHRGLVAVCAVAAAIGGAIVAVHDYRLGLTLSHYDARGHLVVARRIVDSITPGWQQIGAVWLPLPHLLNVVPVQIDAFYRSGASAVAISVAAFAIATGAIGWIVAALTDSASAAVFAAAVFALNPNVLYLQATPMTEPLLTALTTTAVALLMTWCSAGLQACPSADLKVCTTTTVVGVAFALACLTRYEAWPVTLSALALAAWARWRQDEPWPRLRSIGRIAIYPIGAIAAFVIFSRIVIGQWFVSSGFFVPENKALGNPLVAAAEVWWGVRMLSAGGLVLIVSLAGIVGLVAFALASRARAHVIVVVSLAAAAVLPWFAFLKGHPFRIRYMVPLLAVEAIGAGFAVGLLSRFRALVAVAVLATAVYVLPPLDPHAAMVVEAQWEQPNAPVRRTVTDCLRAGYTGETIMASMGSLGHYMQEAARDGFAIRDFLHEGNGDVWLAALDGPRPFVGWVLVEEKANGGDMLARRARENPRFLEGFSRVCEGAGLALYQRQNRKLTMKR